MKKLIAILIVVFVFAVTLSACNEGCQSETQSATENSGAVQVITEAEDFQGSTDSVVDNTQETAGEDTTDADAGTTESAEKVLADNDDFSVTITNCVTDADKGFVMYASLENKTENPVVFKITASALNNKDMHPEFTLEVPAKEKVNAPMVWSADKLEERLVTEVTEVKIELQVVSYGESIKMLSSDIYVINP